ncbi:MAG: hypothetical protein HYY96_15170 [Candidatus Tectomicrobia bacterium]|nr:hypothetical protein [Candidatus Tectomicrobia bacterium]
MDEQSKRASGWIYPGLRIGEALEVAEQEGGLVLICNRCGHVYGPVSRDPKQGAVYREVPLAEVNPLNALSPRDDMVCRQYFCPGCAVMISTNVHRRGDPHLPDMELAPPEANESSSAAG